MRSPAFSPCPVNTTTVVSPGRIGEPLEAVGTVLHSGRRTGVADCRVAGRDGQLVATATASSIVALPVPSGSET